MYKKEIFVFNEGKPLKAIIRNYTKADFHELIRIQREAFPPPFPEDLLWNQEQLDNHVRLFPEGALCVEVEGKICGSMTGLLMNYFSVSSDHSWSEVTDDGYIRNHDPNGNSLYIVDISVSPSYRKLGLGKWLMQSMYETVVHLKLERLLGGGRMPGFHKHAKDLTAEEYVEKLLTGELKDPVITFLLRCGRTPIKPIKDYLEDEESLNYGLLMEWKNPFLARN
ncbi:GNAT family N-acetyltransferase [Bacillus sp. 31A1R]|uniref:GNAT family N-acetyltransferase n=1 Tax=Robertmurraya mangrovi TaxID=3098077 RepID=A0ABU5ITW2_9BACI|nr:GNAT family N-acetyltransferase [Bacillus sp. 31A1R]MDZ5470577.1 GNAT family N-acetyltransferase [Bacillus sp. 31A1R]